jgi:hypothetical protein
MELVDIVATSDFVNSVVGSVSRKERISVPAYIADELFRLNLATPNFHPTVRHKDPQSTGPQGDGGGTPFVSLQAVQVSQKATAMLLRAPVGVSLSSTTPGESLDSQTLSMPATNRGGKSTSRKSKKSSKASYGRRTSAPMNASGFNG